MTTLAVFGLGKLGCPLAVSLAAAGFDVIGVDPDHQKVRDLDSGVAPVYEPELSDLLAEVHGRISATNDGAEAVGRSEATFIIVPTPSGPDGKFSLEYVIGACKEIGRGLAKQDEGFHLVTVTSTVMPGSTGGPIRGALERASGKRAGVNFGLCYSPEFVALGTVIRDLHNPDFVLIGESDPKSGDRLSEIYRRLCRNDPPIARMNLVNAELAKLAVNTFVTTKITFANMLAHICERLPGANVDTVTNAVGLDTRIGLRYLKGGVGFGGPCFPRDNVALISLANDLGVSAMLAETTSRSNRLETDHLAEIVLKRLPQGGVVGLLGLAYKPNTDVIEESQGLLLAQSLVAKGIEVVAYDPAAIGPARRVLGDSVIFAPSAEECAAKADVLVIVTPWQEFRELGLERIGSPPQALVDCWGVLDPEKVGSLTEYVSVGVGPTADF